MTQGTPKRIFTMIWLAHWLLSQTFLVMSHLENLSGELMTLLPIEEGPCEAMSYTGAFVPTFCQGWMGRIDRGSWGSLFSPFSLG